VPAGKLLVLVAIFFLTSVISVVTGSTSLVTVPVMIALGIEAHVAVATNMPL
jgi:anaerobic C4-dicarboxylate transporter